MASGRQLAEENVKTFLSWVSSKTDDDFRAMANRGVLSRTEIAKECGFAKSALDQNPRIKEALRNLEDGLRQRGILPLPTTGGPTDSAVKEMRRIDGGANARDAERLRRLEQENASLKVEVAELKRLLQQFTVLRDALAETGRIPR